MKVIQRFNKFFGLIGVKEISNQVRITGIDGLVMSKTIARIWETQTLNKQMFTSITDTSITIHRFFIPDLVFILSKIRMDPKTHWSGRRTIDKIMQGILKNTWYKVTTEPHASMVDPSRMNMVKWNPLPHQKEFLELFGERIPKYDLRGIVLGASPGTGKAQPLDAAIRTPNGWETMGDMSVGKDIVVPDGNVVKVTGVYPQGVKDIYRITFEDGRSTECCDEHLWEIHNGHLKDPEGKRGIREIVTLKDLRMHYSISRNENRLYVRLPEPELKEDAELSIDPYILGILLGDGHLRDNAVYLSTKDSFIVEEVSKLLPHGDELVRYSEYDYRIVKDSREKKWSRTETNDELLRLGLNGTFSHTKFIPDVYMNGSTSQKLSLIQGLMDADGTVGVSPGRGSTEKTLGKGGSVQFCTTSETLAHQMQELIRSIGGLCKISTKTPSYSYAGEIRTGKLAYILFIRYKSPRSLFRLPRKLERLSEDYQYANNLRLRIKSIEYVGKKEAQCIAVDHPDHLYITDNYIVTHNTFMDLLVMTCVVPPSIAEVKIIISPKKAVHLVWAKTINILFKKIPTHWVVGTGVPMPLSGCEYYVFNFEQLDQAIGLAKHLSSRNVRYFVSVDESHNFADYRSNRTQKLVQLQTVRDDAFFIWMSGSPILKLGAEMASFLKCADPRYDADADRRFKRIFSSSNSRANEIFQHRFGNMMAFIVPKSVVSDTKPTVKELPVRLPPTLSHRFLMSTVRQDMKSFVAERVKFYDNQIKNYRGLVDKGMDIHERTLHTRAERNRFDDYKRNLKMIMDAPDRNLVEPSSMTRVYERTKLFPSLPPRERRDFRDALSAVKNIKLKLRGEALGRVLSQRRSECSEMLGIYCKPEQIMKESLSKTLFFASSVKPIKTLVAHLEKLGFEPMGVYADTNSQLVSIMDRFDNDPNANPICATMQSLSEAVPVIAASTVVLLNRPFRQGTYDQIIARADRLGQQFPVTVVEVTLDTGGEPNVSSRTDEILAEIRIAINDLIGDAFSGPKPEDRVFLELIDASAEIPEVTKSDESIGLV